MQMKSRNSMEKWEKLWYNEANLRDGKEAQYTAWYIDRNGGIYGFAVGEVNGVLYQKGEVLCKIEEKKIKDILFPWY